MKKLVFLLGAVLVFLSCGDRASKREEKDIASIQKPNIVFIFSDDLSWGDLGVNGQVQFSTPNIDKLAKEGLQFANAYAGAPECAPSRASLLTGKHLGHCRIRNNESVRGQDHLLDEDVTIAEILKKVGYTTGYTGKWGVGMPGTEGVPHKQGFDYSFGFYDQLRGHGFYPHYLMENGKKVAIPENYGFDMKRTYKHTKAPEGLHTYDRYGKLIPDGIKDPSKAINSQDYIQEKALKFMQDNHENPFFLYYATQLPHGPVITPDISKFKDNSWDQKHKEWAAMMEHFDRHVGEITATLKELDILENTLIVFAGDNGYSHWGYFGRKRWTDDPIFKNKGPWPYGKFIPRDGGVRVPMFAYWPGKIIPGTTKYITALYDFMATAAELAGAEETQSDGISIVPTLLGNPEKQQQHKYLYWENSSVNPHAQSVRMEDYFAYRSHPDSLLEVYNVIKDPRCKTDISKESKPIVEQVLAYMEEAHVDSKWFVNPGESKETIQAKMEEAKRTGTFYGSGTFPNTDY